jgi:lysozyme family protein
MKKSELKKILKPLINECIKESLMEDGLISGIIAEVVRGMNAAQPIVETQQPQADPVVERMKRNAFDAEQSNKLKEHKQKLMAAIGGGAYNGVDLFEGTSPAPAQGSPAAAASPMSGMAPADAGVDISNLFGSVGRNWNAHMNEMKEGK